MEPTSLKPTSRHSSPAPGSLTPPLRNAVEDEDASVKRKRPRLDSGQRAYQNMGAEHMSPSEQSSQRATSEDLGSLSYDGNRSGSPLDPDDQRLDAPPPLLQNRDQHPNGSPGRVKLTLRDPINTSPHSKQSLQAPLHTNDDSLSARGSNAGSTSGMASPETLIGDEVAQSNIEIEVADPEDIYDPPETTVWHASPELDWRQWHMDIIGRFPIVGESGLQWSDAFLEYWHTIIRAPKRLPEILKATNEWLNIYLEESEGIPGRWKELLDLDPMFWKQLSKVFRALWRDDFVSALNIACSNGILEGETFVTFLSSLLALTKRLLRVDREALEAAIEKKTSLSFLYSTEYVSAVQTTYGSRKLLNALDRLSYEDLLDIPLGALRQDIQSEPSFLRLMAACWTAALAQSRPEPAAYDVLSASIAASQELCLLWLDSADDSDERSIKLANNFFDFFQLLLEKMRHAIKKQMPAANVDLFNKFTTAMSHIVTRTTLCNNTLAHRITDRSNDRDNTVLLTSYQHALFANVIWKSKFLEACIRDGRMEIRIAALELLSTMLITIYNDFIGPTRQTDSVIVQWTSSNLRSSRIIDYLLSVDSHPQLVSRSYNVIGFLAASHTYSTEQTDMIWNCVQSSEDPRMFEQIVAALNTTFNLLGPEPLLYFCSKFLDQSAAAFDHRYRNLLMQIFTQLPKYWASEEVIDLRPFMVLLGLLRQIGEDPHLSNTRRLEIWTFSEDAIKRLQFGNWNFEQRLEVYQYCLDDFSAKKGGATGTCLVFSRLLENYGQSDLIELSSRLDLASTVVTEFIHLREVFEASQVDRGLFSESVKERLRILEKLLLWLPELITKELSVPLWNSMVGANAVGKQACNDAWESLALVAANSSSPNPFLEFGISDYLPSLGSAFHTRSILTFAHQLWEYQERISSQSSASAEVEEKIVQTCRSLFWQLALNTTDDILAAGASRFLVEKCVQETKSLPKEQLSKGQSEFVSKALAQLIDAAHERRRLIRDIFGAEDVSDSVIANRPETLACTVRFQRAFIMLKHLSQNLKAPEPELFSERSESQNSRRSFTGDRIEIKYQASDRGVASSIKTIEIGDQSTVSDMIELLRNRTGFSKFNLIVGGQRVDQEADGPRTIAAAGLKDKGALLLHKIPGSESVKPLAVTQKLKPLEKEIMKYFDQLYDLLQLDSKLGQSILDFLTTFPPHESVVELVVSPTQSCEDILPPTKPCKLLYSLHAMKWTLMRQLEEAAVRDDFMVESVNRLIGTMLSIQLPSDASSTSNNLVVLHLVLVLLMFLKEPVPSPISDKYFKHPAAFVDKIVELCRTARNEQLYSVHQSSFAVLLEAARLSKEVWDHFTRHPTTPDLFKLLLLSNPKTEGRVTAHRTILSVLSTLEFTDAGTDAETKQDKEETSPRMFEASLFLEFIWNTLTSILSDTVTYSATSTQFFELAVDVFKRLHSFSTNVASLQTHLHKWLSMLLQYKHTEVIGQDNVDRFLRGICELINHCLFLFNKAGQTPAVEDSTISKLFDKFLFPPIEQSGERSLMEAVAPVLASETRRSLYLTAFWLSTTTERLTSCINLTQNALLEIDESAVPWTFERQETVRSIAGYPGLNNLSNTCYLNSLTTQLFMNPRFREFILNIDIVDEESQRLLLALKRLFAELQDGWAKSVNTHDLADAIETYEGPLDPAIQMDVDEAFNLIFDRIEGQISSGEDKKRFRTIYGGQIVQQIKSKECDHISERLEPVTAVQCDIQGKLSLEDSLKAYIEGEIMEGDNKYKCSTCDRYVNAVKRACLRDVPDNLIFHLKRFDYDLMQGTRNKLNDYFEFPERIDMTPFTDEYLQEPSKTEPDVYLLTGVLIHSGTAELGHYYSFVRERPTSLQSWVEFNDADVSRYDTRTMQEHCFGGDYRDQVTGNAYPRMYSAYMLFYQRAKSLGPDDERLKCSRPLQPGRYDIPRELALDMATKNEFLARIYCLFDLAHIRYLRDLDVRRKRLRTAGVCTENHRLEKAILDCFWQHLLVIFGRENTRQGCAEVLNMIAEMMNLCVDCCQISIDWLIGPDESRLRLLLLRLPDQKVRQRIGILLYDGLIKLRQQNPRLYGIFDNDAEMGVDQNDSTPRFGLVINRLQTLQKILPSQSRAWIDFYDLLSHFVELGLSERQFMHRKGLLKHAMEILLIDSEHNWSQQFINGKHQGYIKAAEKRNFNLSGLARFLGAFLPLMLSAQSSVRNGYDTSSQVPGLLSPSEAEILGWRTNMPDSEHVILWFFERLAVVDDYAVSHYKPLEDIVKTVTRTKAVANFSKEVEILMCVGIQKSPAYMAQPYLHIATSFMETSSDVIMIEHILRIISRSVHTIDDNGGLEHLDFFKRIWRIRNTVAFPDRSNQMKLLNLKFTQYWAATLLAYPKDDVAEKTRSFLEDMFRTGRESVEDEEMFDVCQQALDDTFKRVLREMNRLLSTNQQLAEHCLEMVQFGEFCLQFIPLEDEEEENAEKIVHIKDVISKFQALIVISDEGSNLNNDSEDLTDVSSMYGEPST